MKSVEPSSHRVTGPVPRLDPYDSFMAAMMWASIPATDPFPSFVS